MNTDKIYAEKIASEYAPKEKSKVKALKRLDAKVKNPPIIFSLIWGVVFCLVFGVGMCLVLQVIGDKTPLMMALGIGIGCVGIIGMSVNYSLYKKILASGTIKYGEDIIALANEIVNEEK